ncbi:transposase [Nocardia tengchongensis]|uniref:transposase n=1 Tax=Nocardia tengchongensis TaxID=2055889 RepID=UPI0036238BF3
MAPPKKYSNALRAQAIQRYRQSDPKPTFRSLAAELGVHHEALRLWIRHAERTESPTCDAPFDAMSKENRRLRKRVAELERVIAIMRGTGSLMTADYSRARY